jgi:cold shock CspA family protein
VSIGDVTCVNAGKGVGCISADGDGPDVFARHHPAIHGDGFHKAQENQQVERETRQGANVPPAEAIRSI